jgi:hypothetical protein
MPLAAAAFQHDIRSQADNFPLITAAGMRFSQANNIVER